MLSLKRRGFLSAPAAPAVVCPRLASKWAYNFPRTRASRSFASAAG